MPGRRVRRSVKTVVMPVATTKEAGMSERPVEGTVRPFAVDVPQEDLEDLRRRITAMRWPDRQTVDDESQGVRLETMRALASYWATDYDWRTVESRLQALPQFITEIDGVD